MRKLLLMVSLSLILVLLTGACVLADSTIKVGYQFNGLYSVNGGITSDINPGATVGYEFTMKGENVEYGAGVEYQFEKDWKFTLNEQKFYFIPVFAVLNCPLSEHEYITARLGYNFFDGNSAYKDGNTLNGGVYYAAGAGINYSGFRMEILYSCNNGSISGDNATDVKNAQWAVNFGYRF